MFAYLASSVSRWLGRLPLLLPLPPSGPGLEACQGKLPRPPLIPRLISATLPPATPRFSDKLLKLVLSHPVFLMVQEEIVHFMAILRLTVNPEASQLAATVTPVHAKHSNCLSMKDGVSQEGWPGSLEEPLECRTQALEGLRTQFLSSVARSAPTTPKHGGSHLCLSDEAACAKRLAQRIGF